MAVEMADLAQAELALEALPQAPREGPAPRSGLARERGPGVGGGGRLRPFLELAPGVGGIGLLRGRRRRLPGRGRFRAARTGARRAAFSRFLKGG